MPARMLLIPRMIIVILEKQLDNQMKVRMENQQGK